MLESVKGMMLTLASTIAGLRRPVTQQYPKQSTPVRPRFMGFPALTWDGQIDEPYCTGCMVCIRNCPTQCMSASMMDNPKHAEGESSRRKIVDYFEINLNRCILCGICVEYCNFDAIVMSHEHEMSTYQRNGDRVGPAGVAGDRQELPGRHRVGPAHRAGETESRRRQSVCRSRRVRRVLTSPARTAVRSTGESVNPGNS